MNEILYDPDLFEEFFGALPQGVLWLEPVREQNRIVDFSYRYANATGKEYLRLQHVPFDGLRISNTPSLTDTMRAGILEDMIRVWETGQTTTNRVHNPTIDRHVQVQRSRFRNGILMVMQDFTEEEKTLLELHSKTRLLEEQTRLADSVFDASINGAFIAAAEHDAQGRFLDFVFTRVNPAFTRLLKLSEKQTLGKRLAQSFPGVVQSGVFDMHRRVYETGRAETMEVAYEDERVQGWYQVSSVKFEDGVLVTFMDISAQKRAASQIEEQRRYLENILQHSSNGITVSRMIRDSSGNVTDARTVLANEAAFEFIGLPKEIMMSKTAVELEPNILQTPYYQECIRVLESGVPVRTQYHTESTGRWLELTVSRLNEDQLITIFTDVTSSKEAQLAMERSARQLEEISNRIQSGIFTLLPLREEEGAIVNFRFGRANRALAQYVNAEPSQLVGALASDWFPGYLTNGLFERYREAWLSREVRRFDFHYNNDGIDVWIDILCSPFEEELLVTFTDFTPVKQLQLELEKSVQELRRSNANLEEFAYVASHDLQEPLRKIRFFAERLRVVSGSTLSEDGSRMLERMEAASERMRTLIDDLLAFSRVSFKPDAFKKVDLNDVVQQVLQDLEATITETGARIQVAQLPQLPGDEPQLRQLFQNLLGNAIKYRKPDTAPLIEVRCRMVATPEALSVGLPEGRTGRYYLIEVVDNGIGFEQEYAEKIFQVFHRLHGRSEYEGTGVGLAIVQKVVTNHGGTITAVGVPDQGATFRILFPAR